MTRLLVGALFSMLYLAGSGHAYAQGVGTCGDPPPVANEKMKTDIQSRAQLLSRYIGDAQLAGKIEVSRTEIFSKYPDGERSDAYHEYQICVLIMADSTMTTLQKIEVLNNVRREFRKPPKRPTRIDGMLDNVLTGDPDIHRRNGLLPRTTADLSPGAGPFEFYRRECPHEQGRFESALCTLDSDGLLTARYVPCKSEPVEGPPRKRIGNREVCSNATYRKHSGDVTAMCCFPD